MRNSHHQRTHWTSRGFVLALALFAISALPAQAGTTAAVVQPDPASGKRGGDGVDGIEKTGGPTGGGPANRNSSGGAPTYPSTSDEEPTGSAPWRASMGG